MPSRVRTSLSESCAAILAATSRICSERRSFNVAYLRSKRDRIAAFARRALAPSGDRTLLAEELRLIRLVFGPVCHDALHVDQADRATTGAAGHHCGQTWDDVIELSHSCWLSMSLIT